MTDATTPCLCDTGLPYQACCRPFHTGQCHAPDALALMRSRYTAVGLGLADYMVQTLHRSSRYFDPNLKRHRLFWQDYSAHTQCLQLVIVAYEPANTEAWVHFKASLIHKGQPFNQEELSHFMKLNQRWLYIDGEMLG